MTDRRLLIVHAHPDDESSQSAGTIARYLDDGAQVTLVTCTLGELGEILTPELEHLTPAELGQYRIGELQESLRIMGLTDHEFLGGPGHYHDTGMIRDESGRILPAPDRPGGTFWDADLLEAANHLVKIIRHRRPQVMATYNPFGGYGHPDHIQAHRVAMYAMQLAGAPSHEPSLGEPWQVQRMVWGTYNTLAWCKGLPIMREQGLVPDELREALAERERRVLSLDASKIAAVVPFGDDGKYADMARRALAAHRTQVRITDVFWEVHSFMQRVEGGGEAYLFGAGIPFPVSDEPASDLFAGLDL